MNIEAAEEYCQLRNFDMYVTFNDMILILTAMKPTECPVHTPSTPPKSTCESKICINCGYHLDNCKCETKTEQTDMKKTECKHELFFRLETSPTKNCFQCGKGFSKGYVPAHAMLQNTEPTLAAQFTKLFYNIPIPINLTQDLSEIATNYFAPIIEKARREGYKEGRKESWNITSGLYEQACIDKGKRQATQEMKERFEKCSEGISSSGMAYIRTRLFGAKND